MYKIVEWFLTLILTFLASTSNGQSTSTITITRGLERDSDRTEGLECEMKTQIKLRAGYCRCRSNHNTFYDHNKHCNSLEEISNSEDCKLHDISSRNPFSSRTEYKATLYTTCRLDKESVTVLIRDITENGGSYWSRTYSYRFFEDIITIEDNRINIRINKMDKRYTGLLVKIKTDRCAFGNDKACVIFKTPGAQKYPYAYDGNSDEISTTPMTTTSTTTPTTTTPTTTTTTTTTPTTTTTTTTTPPTTTTPTTPTTTTTTPTTTPTTPTTTPTTTTTTPTTTTTTPTTTTEENFIAVFPPSVRPARSTMTKVSQKKSDSQGGSKEDDSDIAIVTSVVAVCIVLIAALVMFLVFLRMKKKKNVPLTYPSISTQVYTNYGESNQDSDKGLIPKGKDSSTKDSHAIDIQGTTTQHHEGTSSNDIENYCSLEATFAANEAYASLDTTDPNYFELENTKKEEPMYTILEKEEDMPLYQDPNAPNNVQYHNTTSQYLNISQQNQDVSQIPNVPEDLNDFQMKAPGVLPRNQQTSSSAPASNLNQDEDQEPYQEAYYSEAMSPKPVRQVDISALYAPVIKQGN